MTKEEKLNILGAKLAEAYEAIRDLDITDERFHNVLHLAGEIEWKLDSFSYNPEPVDFFPPVAPKQVLDPAPDPKPGLTADEVKKKMVQYQTAHNLDLAALMQSMGYQKLSTIPAERYGELIELAEAKIKEKD